MILRIDLLEYLGDAAGRVDDECRTNDTPVLSAVHRLLLPHAVLLRDGVVDVGNQRIRKLMFLLEFFVRLGRIGADAKDDRVESLEPREGVSKRARLDGSAGGVVLRIEEEHDDTTAKRRQLQLGIGVRERREVRRTSACLSNHNGSPPMRAAMIAF
jgi:hypothetical protein